jgi:hypothetical protein
LNCNDKGKLNDYKNVTFLQWIFIEGLLLPGNALTTGLYILVVTDNIF